MFAVAGFLAGAFLDGRVGHTPPTIVNGALWAFAAGLVSFLVFASEGPGRPASVRQGAAADGVVAGILAAAVGFVLDRILAAGEGSGGPSAGSFLLIVPIALAGGVVGGSIGLLGSVVLGERFDRPPAVVRRRKTRGGSRRRRRR